MTIFEGLIAATHSPFDSAGDLNLRTVDAQAQILAESKVKVAFVCGSTGESHSLTIEERVRLAERWMNVAAGRLDVFVHVGHNCQRDAMALAAHAQRIGAVATSSIAPSHFRPTNVDDLIEFLVPIAAAAPRIPFYYYDIPGLTGVRLPMHQFLPRAAERIPNLAGIKYSNEDLMTLQACMALGDRFEVLYGNDEILLAALALGVRGAIGSTYNYAAPVYHRVLQAFAAGDLAMARVEQRKSVALVQVLLKFGVIAAGKALVSMLGADCGPVRAPLRALSAQERISLWEQLHAMDIFVRPLQRPGC